MSKKNGGQGGDVIVMCSIAGLLAEPLFPIYSATKSATLMYVRALVGDPNHASTGVRVNCITPTAVDTPLLNLTPERVSKGNFDLAIAMRSEHVIAPPKNVAHAVFKLLSDPEERQGCAVMVTEKGYRIDAYDVNFGRSFRALQAT